MENDEEPQRDGAPDGNPERDPITPLGPAPAGPAPSAPGPVEGADSESAPDGAPLEDAGPEPTPAADVAAEPDAESTPGLDLRPAQPPSVAIEITAAPRVHFAVEQNGLALVRRLRIEHVGERPLHDVLATVTLGNDRATPLELRLDRLDPGGVWELDDLDLRLDPERLRAQEERETVQLRVEVVARRGPVGSAVEPVELLAWNEWPGIGFAPELTAAYVLPNHPSLDAVLVRAAEHLEAATGSSNLSGYQEPGRAIAVAAALWAALAERGLVYAEPPASFEHAGQKVRLPHRVLSGGLGTCLDLTLLFAAAAEQAGLHPLVVITDRHAFVGLWLHDECFPEAVIEDPLRLRKRVQVGQIAVVECTALTHRPRAGFAEAREAAQARLADLGLFECAIDVHAARRLGIRPLATRITDDGEVPELGEPVRVALERELETHAPALPTPEPQSVAPAHEPLPTDPAARRLAGWKRRLLDLSLRNRLLNFRPTLRTAPLCPVDLAALEDALAAGTAFSLLAEDERTQPATLATRGAPDPRRAYLAEEFSAGRLRLPLSEADTEKRLREIHRGARLAVEESGANTLYLAVAFLEWREADAPDRELRAPLLLLPLELERLPLGRGWRLRSSDEDPRINDSLLEKLAAEHVLDPTPLADLPTDGAGLDVAAILKRWREAILDRAGWDVVEEAWVGLFSFSKLVMWRDLEARRDELLESRAVRFLVERPDEPFDDAPDFPDPRRADSERDQEDLFLPLDADSSQLTAVLAAVEGRTFVLEGPPGTGKSQTIANLIAHALGAGQRVLFVAEKRAALEVVQRRLEHVGLGPFCLELHSNKIAKREVVAQLGRALEASDRSSADPRRALAGPLARVREELSDHTQQLHRRGPLGRSLFEVVGRLLELEGAPRLALRLNAPAELTADQLADLLTRAEDLARAADLAEPGAGHPLAAVHRTELGPAARTEVDAACADLRADLSSLLAAARAPLEALGLEDAGEGPSGAVIAAGLEVAELLAAGPDPGAALMAEAGWDAVRERLLDALERAGRALARRTSLLTRWDARLFDRDLAALTDRVDAVARRSFLTRWWAARALRADLRPLRAGSEVPGLTELAADLREARAIAAEEDELGRTEAARLFGERWREDAAALETARLRLATAGTLRRRLIELSGVDVERAARLRTRWAELGGPQRDLLGEDGPLGRQFASLRSARVRFEGSWQRLVEALSLNAAALRGSDDERPLRAPLEGLLDAVRDVGARLRDWCLWQAARSAAEPTVLAPIVHALDRGELDACQATAACERSLLEAWAAAAVDADEGLRRFHGVEQDGRVERFVRLDHQWLEATRAALAARMGAGVPTGGDATSANSEVGILQRELRKKRGHLPVRQLVERLPHLLPQLAPCVLASPLSTAQFLDAGLARFDLVVFDEASQIPVWDGVGAMARGRAAIVVGDSKQLPPTSFFAIGDDDDADGEGDYEELESLLDECVAARLPRLHLDWHYRSRHESLIAFSNARYYEGRLETFPAPGGVRPGLGLRWRHVKDGVYDRSGMRTNRVEAEALVARTVELLEAQSPDDPDASSVGIVTFSLPQQQIVEELLEEARSARPELEPWFDPGRIEPVLVKNLENVQGDERDVILLGVGYGPDAHGKLSMNLGPLNRAGGERRLNVAVTRARRALEIFSSFAPEALDLRRTGAAGVRDLRSYLEFAASGHLAHDRADVERGDAAGVVDRLAGDLEARGHRVARRVGRSSFRVDLGVGGTSESSGPESFDLGLLLDGASYAAGATVRDRDRLRGQVLAGLGWQLARVWTLDVWSDRAGAVERIEAALAASRAARTEVAPADPVPDSDAGTEAEDPNDSDGRDAAGDEGPREASIASAPPLAAAPSTAAPVAAPDDSGPDSEERATVEPDAEPSVDVADEPPSVPAPAPRWYSPTKLRSNARRQARFHDEEETARIADALLQVVRTEGPIAVELATRRVSEAWGLNRLTKRVLERVAAARAATADLERPIERDGFLWPAGVDPQRPFEFRPSPGGEPEREADELPLEEVASAAAHALDQNVALPLADLLRETAQLFGFTRLGSVLEARMRAGVELLAARGGCVLEGDRVRLR